MRASAQEAQAVANLYDGQLLLGNKVNVASFLSALQRADILHYAGHASIDPGGQGHLLLAPGEGDDGRLGWQELKQASGSPELVVLSACATAEGGLRASEGPQSLAMPFLRKGTPAVVVSLWPVDDRETRDLMVLFHSFYKKSGNAPEALNRAIIQMKNQPRSISNSTLAAFQALGGNNKKGNHKR